ncbi:iron chaperone [Microbacterium thalassium]|uniref:Uncharacterized protein YdhG (YjbR/CyaY superfamily) n=1 Tax=Microbacterium thalassium TaxID=362649 RepID=A0A7X0KTQ5_9MICO|nr:hypothetical protein [Microbacterium thalassium]MBB6390375.1 uncharacterized protein YdhG (YjbR/CyaY superfamily) [Microbacterium thalassium]GLK25484.1 hypothetical protein GCM10017607_28030 [Microbacterium thalassium]
MAKESSGGFSADEKAAMKQRAAELRAEEKRGKDRAAGLAAVEEAIAALPADDKDLAERLHALVTEVAPDLDPKTWYGFPAYARTGKVVVFFKPASKFKSRYASVGFEEAANLDDGPLWVTSYAIVGWDDAVEKTLRDQVARAAS